MSNGIPATDNQAIRNDIEEAIRRLWRATRMVGGPESAGMEICYEDRELSVFVGDKVVAELRGDPCEVREVHGDPDTLESNMGIARIAMLIVPDGKE